VFQRLVAFLLCTLCGLAGVPARAGVSHDPALTWRTLQSAHFRVHFHDGEELLAQRTVATAERVHTQLSPVIGWQPEEPVDIVLSDRLDVSNGYATFFPADRMTIFVTPPDEVSSLEDHGGWLDTVLTHEYVHILHLDKATHAPNFLRHVFGRNVLLFPNALQPSWLIEGIATWHETDRARGIGRGQSSYYDMLLRMEVDGGVKPVSQINQHIATWPGGTTPYLYGVAFYNFIADQQGAERIKKLVDNYSDNIIPFRINSNSRQTLGAGLTDLWPRFEQYLKQRHGARLDTIRRAGVVAGERVTRHGYTGGAARVLPDGDIVYLHMDGASEPALRRLGADGALRWRSEVHGGAHLTLHPRAGALLAQPEINRNANYFYDLYRVDLERGGVRRLTHGARYRYAAWSPDGSRILAVHNEGGKHALHLLDDAGKLIEVLAAGEQDVVFADPDWSPDGTSVALAAWRPQGGWNLERFILSERRFELLTRDSAIEAQPQFTQDGKALLFTSDHGGVYNLRRLDFASGKVTTLSNVEGGAFHPTQARVDGPVYYTGYHAAGFDIYRLDAPAALPTPAAAPGPSAIVAKDDPRPEGLKVSDYSPYDGLRPRWWLPHVAIDSQRTELGVMTSGWDPLMRHVYYLDLAYDFTNQWFAGSVDYIYDRFYPTFKLHASRYSKLYLDPDDDPLRVTTSDTYMGEMVLPFLRYRRDFTLHAAGYTVRDADGWTATGVTPQADRTDNVLGYAFVYDSTRRYPLSISRSRGVQLSVAAETSDAIEGSDYSGEVYTLDGRAFLPLAGEHVLALRLAGGWGSASPRAFRLGGSLSANAAPLPLDTALLNTPFNQREFALRGYDSGSTGLTGRRMLLAAAEWRFPIARIERGIMAPPLAIHQVYGSAFAETGDAWDTDRTPGDYSTGAGIEANAEVNLFYNLAFHLRLGYAYGFADNGSNQVYLQLGSSF
jgi:Omp85 superfamily domain/WD40-like Beta Propeller Repeat